VAADCVPSVQVRARYVSRGGDKLEAALRDLELDPRGLDCIDVGSSTGGFTDCLLQRGARSVLALDVGHDQLAPSLREDPRVELHEGTHVRDFALPQERAPADLLVADLAFISLTKVMTALVALVRPGGRLLLLVKPQFELEPAAIGRGGIVRDPALRERARIGVLDAARAHGLGLLGACACSALDPRANEEGFLLLARAAPPAPGGGAAGLLPDPAPVE
jgi:23S rRNA (cytidine1920-2'-O)/16S rRNA (cytidine1409-2'-O)-methyltransferase